MDGASSSSPPATRGGTQALHVNQRCELTSYGRGRISFVGQTSFSPGIWIGISLDEPSGKHDGVVQGKRYFTAHSGHGLFVRSSQVHVIPDNDQHDDGSQDQDSGEQEQDQPPSPSMSSSRPPTAAAFSSAAPVASARQSVSRTSMTSSNAARTTSPTKPNVVRSGRTSAIPGSGGAGPASSTGGGAFAAARRSAAASPQKRVSMATTTPGVVRSTQGTAGNDRSSPFKTPARPSLARPTASTAPRTSVAAGPRTSTVSPAKAPLPASRTPAAIIRSRTPAAATAAGARARTPGSALAQARSAVQAGRATDTATARAGLRPVAKTRASMAPPVPATYAPRTPAAPSTARTAGAGLRGAQTTVARRVPGTAASSSSNSSTAPRPAVRPQQALSTGRTARTATSASSSVPSSRQPTLDGREGELDDEEEDLMALSIDDEADALGHTPEYVGKHSSGREPASPSLRKAPLPPDHMSLTRGPTSSAVLARNAAIEASTLQREIEELRAKLRIAEKKREEDRDIIREAERIQQESEQFLAVKPKMTAKQQELQDELKELRRQIRERTTGDEEAERQLTELNDQLELLSLDKEMAEERAEGALEELQMLKDRVEELELDAEVLREENARYESGPVDDNERLSVGYIQLEKQNERLRDALIRLRDLTSEADAEQKQRITELEKELRGLDELQASFESGQAKLAQRDALIEDLKVQLDDAIGAEEMLEQMSERNMALTEKLDEMRVAIEDLEALKDLNDELEETHIETEHQLQEELDLKEMQMREFKLRTESLEANIVDYESTFAQFRELVLNLQSENESLRNDEKARDASRTAAGMDDQAMLNLNLKLQSSTLKSQAKTIELEIGKLDAAQAKQQLEMTNAYLPKAYFGQDKDAVESLLFFQRIAAKTEILKSIVEGNNDIANSLTGVVNERLITICQMRHSLAHFIASSRQIYALVRLASIPTFLKSGRMFKELMTIERRIDQFVDLLRREELKEDECAQDFRRFVKMLGEFEFALLEGSVGEALDSDLAAKELGSTILFELDLDTISAALGFSKQTIAGLYNEYQKQLAAAQAGEVVAEDAIEMHLNELDIDEAFFTPVQELINNLRSTKVPARKMMRRLLSIYNNGEAVKMDAIIRLPVLGKLTSQLVAFAATIARSFAMYVNNVRTNKTPFELKEILATVEVAAREAMSSESIANAAENTDITVGRGAEPWKTTLAETAQLGTTVTELLNAAMENENVDKIAGTFPWLGRVEELRIEQESNAESQRVIAKQTEDLRDLFKQIKVRDEVIEENRIKIERLGKNLQRSKQDNETVTELRDDLIDTTRRMKAYEEGNSALQGELEQLQRQYERLLNEGDAARAKGLTAPAEADEAGANASRTVDTGVDQEGGTASVLLGGAGGGPLSLVGGVGGVLPSSNYETSYLLDQVEALRGAVKYLRTEIGLLKGRDLLQQVEQLPSLAPRLMREDSGVALDDMATRKSQHQGAGDEVDQSTFARGLPRSKKEGRKTGKGLPTGLGIGYAGAETAMTAREEQVEARKQASAKRLAQEWMQMVSSPRVVVLTRTEANHQPARRKAWVPMAQLPDVQLRDQQRQRAKLLQRIEAMQSTQPGHSTAIRG